MGQIWTHLWWWDERWLWRCCRNVCDSKNLMSHKELNNMSHLLQKKVVEFILHFEGIKISWDMGHVSQVFSCSFWWLLVDLKTILNQIVNIRVSLFVYICMYIVCNPLWTVGVNFAFSIGNKCHFIFFLMKVVKGKFRWKFKNYYDFHNKPSCQLCRGNA